MIRGSRLFYLIFKRLVGFLKCDLDKEYIILFFMIFVFDFDVYMVELLLEMGVKFFCIFFLVINIVNGLKDYFVKVLFVIFVRSSK